MPSLRVIAALVLALLWLPATLHCGLDAAGLMSGAPSCCDHDVVGHDAAQPECGSDNCEVVEGGNYQPSGNIVKVAAPLVQNCLADLLAPVFVPTSEVVVSGEVESPPEIRRTWQFAVRAALSPRAPSFVS